MFEQHQEGSPGKTPGKTPWEKFPGVPIFLLLLTLIGALPVAAETAPPRVDPFYTQLLRDGIRAYDRQDYGEAVRVLRLACFGFLDEPPVLAEGLGRLVLAQAAVNDPTGVRQTFDRLVEVERRFDAYSQADLPVELRRRLEEVLPRFVGKAALQDWPTSPRAEPSETPPEPPLNGAVIPVSEALPEAARDRLGEARRLLRQARTASDLEKPLQLAREVAEAHPDSTEAQHLTAEIAYKASRWQEAARYFRRGGDPGDDKPTLLFFMAVSLYESGDGQEAVALLRRSLPRLQRTAYVDGYVEKILGKSGP